ncbi:hypothetical protein V6N12_018329 [Hibiscus sabdariffa]|uniref:Uncharacterized protein n=1 Tax=Hibiscus sabdariffa TaxID=183260 RepID=A0ABR2BQE0_9ROSI
MFSFFYDGRNRNRNRNWASGRQGESLDVHILHVEASPSPSHAKQLKPTRATPDPSLLGQSRNMFLIPSPPQSTPRHADPSTALHLSPSPLHPPPYITATPHFTLS